MVEHDKIIGSELSSEKSQLMDEDNEIQFYDQPTVHEDLTLTSDDFPPNREDGNLAVPRGNFIAIDIEEDIEVF